MAPKRRKRKEADEDHSDQIQKPPLDQPRRYPKRTRRQEQQLNIIKERGEDSDEQENEPAPYQPPPQQNMPTSAGDDSKASEDSISSSSESDSSDSSSSEDEEQEEQAANYQRIVPARSYYAVQVPCTLIPTHSSVPFPALQSFNARFPLKKDAARWADRALIAMWGRSGASPHLNFSLSDYPPSTNYRRYTIDLTRFLDSIKEASKQAQRDFTSERRKNEPSRQAFMLQRRSIWEKNKLYYKVKKVFKLPDETQRCGVCPPCRFWQLRKAETVKESEDGSERVIAGHACIRRRIAKEMGYSSKKLAEKMIETIDNIEEIVAEAEGSTEEEEVELEESEDEDGTAVDAVEGGRKKNKRTKGKRKQVNSHIDWIEHPSFALPKRLGAVRTVYKQRVEKAIAGLDASLASAEAAAAFEAFETLQNAVEHGDQGRGHLSMTVTHSAPEPRDVIGPPKGHKELLQQAQLAAKVSGAKFVALEREDEERFDGYLDGNNIIQSTDGRVLNKRQCPDCNTYHNYPAAPEACLLIQAGYGRLRLPPKLTGEACLNCSNREVVGCEECVRGKGVYRLPDVGWYPEYIRAPWIQGGALPQETTTDATAALASDTHVIPNTNPLPDSLTAVMQSLQNIGNAAVVNFNRPDIAGTLGPEALLAMGLVVQEVADAQLKGVVKE